MRSTSFTARGDQIRWADIPGAAARPARVYVHGLGGSGQATFGHVAGHPDLAGSRSLVVDLPGHGHSDRPADFGYTLDDHAAAVAAVLDGQGLEHVDLVGHSMGGSVSTDDFVLDALDRLRRGFLRLHPRALSGAPRADHRRLTTAGQSARRVLARGSADRPKMARPSSSSSSPATRMSFGSDESARRTRGRSRAMFEPSDAYLAGERAGWEPR